MSNPSVVAIVVTYNSEKDIKSCIDSLLEQDYENLLKIIVVDSASKDHTKNIIQNYNSDKIELFASEKNLYFAGGNNKGYELAKKYNPDYIALLNPDAKADKNWLSEMIKLTESDNAIGIIGAKTLFWNNPNEGLINSTGLIYDGFMQAYDRGFMQKDKGQFDTTEQVSAVSGCNMLIKVKMLHSLKELFWEKLQMYLEDLELCIRAKKLGWKIIYTANTTVGHKYMQSTSQNPSVIKQKRIMKNWLMIGWRHYKLKSKLAMLKKYLQFRLFNNKAR